MSLSSKIPTMNRRAPVRVLVVDPDEASRRVTEGTVNRWGYAAYGTADLGRISELLEVWAPRFLIVCGTDLAVALLAHLDGDEASPANSVILVQDPGSAIISHPRVMASFERPIPYHRLLTALHEPPRLAGFANRTGK